MMPPSILSNAWEASSTAFVTLGILIGNIIFTLMTKRDAAAAARAAAQAASKAETAATVAKTTAVKADKAATEASAERAEARDQKVVSDRKLDAVHTLVDGAMSAQMKLTAAFAKALAAKPDATAEEKEAAAIAEKTYRDHEAKMNEAISIAAENEELRPTPAMSTEQMKTAVRDAMNESDSPPVRGVASDE